VGSSQSGELKRRSTRLKKSIDLSALRSPHIIAVQKGNFWALGSMFGFRLSANVAVRPMSDIAEVGFSADIRRVDVGGLLGKGDRFRMP
jgi:hypothetical protein